MTAPNNQPAPEGFRRLSSKWLETNVAPKDVIFHYPYDDLWGPSQYQGKLIPSYDRSQFTYATARTDLPREAYADSEPGAEVASERAEETETTPCLICGKPVEGYVAEYCCSGHECGCMGAPMEPCTCSKECDAALFENIGMPMEERRIKAGIAKWDELATLRAQLDAKEAEVEHRAKQRDEFQNLFIEASDGFNRRGEQLARLTAELDAVRKERDQFQERCSSEWAVAVERDAALARCGELERAVAQARNWEFLDNHKEGCQMFGLHPKPCSCGKEQRIAYLDQFLTPSQQPDNLKGGEPCAQTVSVSAQSTKDSKEHIESQTQTVQSTESASNPQPESPIPSGVGQPSRPEPVKAGEWLPIESAPKDGTYFLVGWFADEEPDPERFTTVVAFYGQILGTHLLSVPGRYHIGPQATHWQPLPAPPIAPEGKATEGEG